MKKVYLIMFCFLLSAIGYQLYAQEKKVTINSDSLAIAQKWDAKIKIYLNEQKRRADFVLQADSIFNRYQGGIITLMSLKKEELENYKNKKEKSK